MLAYNPGRKVRAIGAIEEVRSLLQDIAPGLKSLPEHVAALENRGSLTSIVEMNGTIKDRFAEVGRQAEKRHAQNSELLVFGRPHPPTGKHAPN